MNDKESPTNVGPSGISQNEPNELDERHAERDCEATCPPGTHEIDPRTYGSNTAPESDAQFPNEVVAVCKNCQVCAVIRFTNDNVTWDDE